MFNTVASELMGFALFNETAIKETDDHTPEEIFEYVVPFLNAYRQDYSVEWLPMGKMKVSLSRTVDDEVAQIADYLNELLEHGYSEMNGKQYRLISQFLNSVKCSFEAEKVKHDWHAIELSM
jgi:hypothetical protein